ncbi:DUF2063 domain-containing protein [Paracoccus sp. M683]|uniref:HvfC/BufC N-terminal domain-containing protein n=1 Tax=Paracoccus sp. M683 TaxID=2594268 RepID=UPI001180E0FB|nr:DNA-binding domain-containing protein [Paracoccus sp. M683]TRW99597.1 DUF2063 domain-containing protein [Paracoccus sp. M683]
MPLPAETSHVATTGGFRRALRAGPVPQGVTIAAPCGPGPDRAALEARFAVYRNNVARSLSQALARRFPVVERLVGAAFFAAMAADFIAAHPPRSPVLLLWGAEFATFLRGFPPVAALPYLPDVARLEYARGQAYHAADHDPVDGSGLARIGASDPARLRLVLAPSLRLLDCNWPAATIWQANQPGQNPSVNPGGAEQVLIWRQADFQVPVRRIAPDQARFLRALMAGENLAKAALLTADATPILTLLLTERLIADVRTAS